MNYELAKKLKDAGFPYDWCIDGSPCLTGIEDSVNCLPDLSELIEACGENLLTLQGCKELGWDAIYGLPPRTGQGKTPEEAVANLWLELNKNANRTSINPSMAQEQPDKD